MSAKRKDFLSNPWSKEIRDISLNMLAAFEALLYGPATMKAYAQAQLEHGHGQLILTGYDGFAHFTPTWERTRTGVKISQKGISRGGRACTCAIEYDYRVMEYRIPGNCTTLLIEPCRFSLSLKRCGMDIL